MGEAGVAGQAGVGRGADKINGLDAEAVGGAKDGGDVGDASKIPQSKRNHKILSAMLAIGGLGDQSERRRALTAGSPAQRVRGLYLVRGMDWES